MKSNAYRTWTAVPSTELNILLLQQLKCILSWEKKSINDYCWGTYLCIYLCAYTYTTFYYFSCSYPWLWYTLLFLISIKVKFSSKHLIHPWTQIPEKKKKKYWTDYRRNWCIYHRSSDRQSGRREALMTDTTEIKPSDCEWALAILH